MKELKRENEPDMAIVGVLLLIVFGIMILNDRPVQSPRPYDTLYPHPLDRNLADYSYESWPWEDPFDFKPGEILERDLYEIEAKDIKDLVNPNIAEKQSLQVRLRKKLDANDLKKERTGLCSEELDKKLNNISVKILISVVEVHPRTVENKENRTRQRYAVHAGLTASGYTASESNRLNFCTSDEASQEKYNVRWEHFSHNSERDIVVAWIPNNLKITNFKTNLQEGLCQNNCIGSKNNFKSITKLPNRDDIGPIETKCIQSCIRNIEFPDFEFLSKDTSQRENLAGKLVKELKLRRIDKLSEIAIISEQGYSISKELTTSFVEALKKTKNLLVV